MHDLRRNPLLLDRRLGAALTEVGARAVVATSAMLDEPTLVPACELVVLRLDERPAAASAVRLVRHLARREPTPRIVIVGGNGDRPVEVLLAGADAWVDEHAETTTLVAALSGKVPNGPRRRWCGLRRQGC